MSRLALLYNAPRAASIVADVDSVLFSLDRDTFNNIVKTSAIKKREKYEEFLRKLEILKDLTPYERGSLCDILLEETFKDGQAVVKEGEPGERLYFIEEGRAKTYKRNRRGEDELVFEFQQNDYFGELALIKNTPRAATVVAKGNLKTCSIDRDTFKRLLGPLELVLSRNVARYQKFVRGGGEESAV